MINLKGNIKELVPQINTKLLDLKHDQIYVVEIKEYRAKRSLNANAYAWMLIEKLSKVLRNSKDEVYELMLQRYGTLLRDTEENLIVIPTKGNLESNEKFHLKNIGKKYVNENQMNLFAVIKGSSEYNTKEMSEFIDGVVSECKNLDIETLTPQELQIIKENWG